MREIEKNDLDDFNSEFIKTIDFKKHQYSPILLDFESEPMKAVRCNKGFWLSTSFGDFLKKDNGELQVFSLEEIKFARARYIFKHPKSIEEKIPKKESVKFGEPIFTARLDNPREMEILKNVFHVDEMEKADFNPEKIMENLENEINKTPN